MQWGRTVGVPARDDDDFYSNAVVKGYYKNHVRKLLNRINTITRVEYKDDSTIIAWELMNEPRCKIDDSGNTLNVSSIASGLKIAEAVLYIYNIKNYVVHSLLLLFTLMHI